jgi:hypothetical protein
MRTLIMRTRPKYRPSWVELRKGTAYMTDKELREAQEDTRKILERLKEEIYKLNHPKTQTKILY